MRFPQSQNARRPEQANRHSHNPAPTTNCRCRTIVTPLLDPTCKFLDCECPRGLDEEERLHGDPADGHQCQDHAEPPGSNLSSVVVFESPQHPSSQAHRRDLENGEGGWGQNQSNSEGIQLFHVSGPYGQQGRCKVEQTVSRNEHQTPLHGGKSAR